MTENTATEYTERRTWREKLDSLLALVGMGEDVDPTELADTQAKAEAEATVEGGRQARVERENAAQARREAAERADTIAADIDPECHVKGLAEARQAWSDYQDVVIAVAARFAEHERNVSALLEAVADSGAPTVKADLDDEAEGGAILLQPMSRPIPVWGGVKFPHTRLAGSFLPHRESRARNKIRFHEIDQQG